MAFFYSNENFPFQTVTLLREMGHDVLTSLEAGNANQSIPDDQVLAFATEEGRCLLTLNRLHFIRLHGQVNTHAGIVVCNTDYDYQRQARKIDAKVSAAPILSGSLLRIHVGD